MRNRLVYIRYFDLRILFFVADDSSDEDDNYDNDGKKDYNGTHYECKFKFYIKPHQ